MPVVHIFDARNPDLGATVIECAAACGRRASESLFNSNPVQAIAHRNQ